MTVPNTHCSSIRVFRGAFGVRICPACLAVSAVIIRKCWHQPRQWCSVFALVPRAGSHHSDGTDTRYSSPHKKKSLVRSQLPRPHHISVYLRGGAYRLKLTVWSGQAWRLETVLCKESQTDTWRPFLLTLVQDGPDVYPGQTIAIEQVSGINNFYLALLFAYIVPVHKEVASSPVAPL